MNVRPLLFFVFSALLFPAISEDINNTPPLYDLPNIKARLDSIAQDAFSELSRGGGSVTTQQISGILDHIATLQQSKDPWSMLLSLDLQRLVDICLLNAVILETKGSNNALGKANVLSFLDTNRPKASKYMGALYGKGSLMSDSTKGKRPDIDTPNVEASIEQVRKEAGRSYFKELQRVQREDIQNGDPHDYALIRSLAQHDESTGIRFLIDLSFAQANFVSDPTVRLPLVEEALLQNPMTRFDTGSKVRPIELVSLFEKYSNLDEERFRNILVYVLAPYIEDRSVLMVDGKDNYLAEARRGIWDAPPSP